MTYYYAPYVDEYVGFAKPRRSETLKNALKGLKKYISEKRCEAGTIYTNANFNDWERNTKGLVGTLYVQSGKRKITVEFNGRKITTYGDVYLYVPKRKTNGRKKVYKLMADGRLIDLTNRWE